MFSYYLAFDEALAIVQCIFVMYTNKQKSNKINAHYVHTISLEYVVYQINMFLVKKIKHFGLFIITW